MTLTMLPDVLLAILFFAAGAYFLVADAEIPLYQWFIGFLSLGYFYFRQWKRPLKQVRFFDDHFEITGWHVNITDTYDKIEDLRTVRNVSLWVKNAILFTVSNYPFEFKVPYRTIKSQPNLYSWLLERNVNSSRGHVYANGDAPKAEV